MDESISNEWFEFPLSVFVDTQVFISEAYDFSAKGKFALLKKQIDNGKVQLLVTDILRGEVECHIKEDIGKSLGKLNCAITDRCLAIFREGKYRTSTQSVDALLMTEYALKAFNDYLKEVDAISLDTKDVDLCSVVTDYFSAKPPFGEGKKKNEFPDAFNVSLLQKYSAQNGKIYVVSGDCDFSNIENMYRFKSINELLDTIISQDNRYNEICKQAKKYLQSTDAKDKIFVEVESELMDIGSELYVDGTDTDRKGMSSGVEYDETELSSVSNHGFTELEIVNFEYKDKAITIMTNCKSELEFICSFFDEENSCWDSEEKAYGYQYYGKIQERHHGLIPIEICLTFENDGENIEFSIDEVNVDKDIEFNQNTLQEDGRIRLDNPYSVWEDEENGVESHCPDCGCKITFENDGGNGFCIKCAPEH